MGLRSDIEEVTQYWSRSPWRVKLFLLLALFLSTSSLASLSEAVFKWKGFILDALVFYRTHLSHPFSEFVSRLSGHPVPAHFVDGAVLLGLFHATLIRALLLRRQSLPRRITDVAFFLLTYSAMLYVMADQPDRPNETTVWVLYPAFLLAAYVLTDGAERLLAMSYMLVPVLVVAILAAVSSGLAR
jgi:hypothetical protein